MSKPNLQNPANAQENPLEIQILQKLTKDQLEEEIEKKYNQFHGLLTKEAAIKLIALDLGLLKREIKPEQFLNIKELQEGQRDICIIAKVFQIFPKETSSKGKVFRDMRIDDETGKINLRLWEEDTNFYSKIKTGDKIQINGAYVKNENINLSYNGTVELLEKAPFDDLTNLTEGKSVNVKGEISKIENFSRFFIKSGEAERKCILLVNPERGKLFSAGASLIVENAIVKNGELHIGTNSRLLYKPNYAVSGIVSSVEIDNDRGTEQLSALISEKRIIFDRNNALKFLNLNISPDILLSTLVSLKKDYLINSFVQLKGRQENNNFVFEK